VSELRILLVEDNPDDERLISRELQKGGLSYRVERVDSREEFRTALRDDWDLVISDYNLPGFSGLEALTMLKEQAAEVPFILLSGTVGEITAVESIQAGADDYLLKQNLIRLVPAVKRAIREADERRKAEEVEKELEESRRRLLESELQYRSIVEDQTEMIIRFDRTGIITFANGAYARANGCRPEDLIGKSCFGKIHPEDVNQAKHNIAAVCPENPFTAMQMRVILDDGSIVWREWQGRGIFDSSGQLIACQAVGRDVTALIEAQQKLRESEQRYRSIVEDQREMIVRFDKTGAITFANAAYARAGSCSPDELIGQSCFHRIHPDDQVAARRAIAAISFESPYSFIQLRVIRDDGTIEWGRMEWSRPV
jgi:PAS domain S-box-containing protein